MMILKQTNTGWWFQTLWKIWVRQLGWWHSQFIQFIFQTTNQIIYIYIVSYTIVIIVSYNHTLLLCSKPPIRIYLMNFWLQTTCRQVYHLSQLHRAPTSLLNLSLALNLPKPSEIEHDIAGFSMVFSLFSHELRRVFHVFSIWLVVYLPLWKIWVRQWEGWHPIYYPIYEMENKIHVSNNQPAMFSPYVFSINVFPVRFRHPKKSPKSLNVQWFQRPLRLPSHPEPEMFPITGFQERLGFSRTKSLVLSEVPINHGHVWRKNNNYSYI